MQKLTKILTLLAVTSLIMVMFPAVQVSADTSWLGTWAHRIPYTFNSTYISGNLTDFPLKIWVSNSSGESGADLTPIFTELGNNSTKIAVTTSDMVTQCYVEVVSWDSTNKTAELYTKVPIVTNATATMVYLYYDNLQSPNTAYVGTTTSTPAKNVWDSSFMAVYHMNDGADNTAIYDSTSNVRNGLKTGTYKTSMVDGIKGKAQYFNGTSMTINLGADLSVDNDFLIESFVKLTNVRPGRYYLVQRLGSKYNYYINYDADGDGLLKFLIYDGSYIPNGYSTIAPDTNLDTGIALKRVKSSTLTLYLDGISNKQITDTTTGSIVSSANTVIGNQYTTGEPYLTGLYNELRFSNIARSDAWIKLTNYSERDTAGSWGSIQNINHPSPTPLRIIELA